MKNHAQIAIQLKGTLEELLIDWKIAEEAHAKVSAFWQRLYKVMSETKLGPGQHWDASHEWS